MENDERISCEEIKRWDMVNYLSNLGYQPHHIRGNDYWYLSPLRTERTPSFKISRKLNLWYDHGIGQGGSLVDFLTKLYDCSIKDLLEKLEQNFSFQRPERHKSLPVQEKPESKIEIVSVKQIHSLILERYLHRRNIPLTLAKKWCREVLFSLHEKEHTAIGFKNRSGGWELRNDWFKGSSHPKSITHLQKGATEIAVFEGFFDFLSYLKIAPEKRAAKQDYLILNSTAFWQKTLPFLMTYPSIRLFLDNDETGKKCTALGLAKGEQFRDESSLYKGYKDLNEWHCQMGKGSRKNLTIHPG